MKLLKTAAVLLSICAVLVIGAAVYAYSLNQPAPGTASGRAIFTVVSGETVSDISSRLLHEGVIKSSTFFSVYSKLTGSEGGLRTGTYLIAEDSTTVQIHDLLLSGRQVLTKVTFPEGWTASQIARHTGEAGITDSTGFIEAVRNPDILAEYGIPAENADGYLFPDTYLFQQGIEPDSVVRHLLDTFFTRLETIYPEYQSLTAEDLHQKVILASFVEREYKDPEEADLIASVFYNRLSARMRLQSCATVAYVMTEIQGNAYPEFLTYADLEIQNPYNTYRNGGLPPGPIANPGPAALAAVFFPAEADYLYFVLQNPSDGSHYFSKSLGEHNTAKSLYLKSP